MTSKQIKILIFISIVVLILLFIIFRRKIFKIILKPEQEAFISKLHPKVQNKFRQFIKRVQDETGYSVILTSGYRTWLEQQQEYEANPSNAKPGRSMHNYGLAIDINAFKGINYLRKSSTKQDWELSGIPGIARDMGFTWGGDFISYKDNVHIGLDDTYDVNKLLAAAINKYGNDYNLIKGNNINLT